MNKQTIDVEITDSINCSVSEDGILTSDDKLDKLKIKTYDKDNVEFGENTYPLNV